MTEAYCVVGRTSFLTGEVEPVADSLELSAHAAAGHLADIGCTLRSGVGEIAVSPEASHTAPLDEAARLFLRLAMKLHGPRADRFRVGHDPTGTDRLGRALADDGFVPGPDGYELRHRTGAFGREAKAGAHDMDEVYSDPLTVPWNFVPVTSDLIEPLLATARPGARVLDLGCGYGKNLRVLAESGVQAHGVDVAAGAAERAREIAPGAVEVVVGSATQLPWPDRTFDAVLDAGCIHCLPAQMQPRAVREVSRVLAADGLLYSAILPPRDSAWLESLPFAAEEFGIAPVQAREMLRRHFSGVEMNSHPHITNLVASRPRSDGP